MNDNIRVLANADIKEIVVASPGGHQHLRATITMQSGVSISAA